MRRIECDGCGNDTFHAVYQSPRHRDGPDRFTFECADCDDRVYVELGILEADP